MGESAFKVLNKAMMLDVMRMVPHLSGKKYIILLLAIVLKCIRQGLRNYAKYTVYTCYIYLIRRKDFCSGAYASRVNDPATRLARTVPVLGDGPSHTRIASRRTDRTAPSPLVPSCLSSETHEKAKNVSIKIYV